MTSFEDYADPSDLLIGAGTVLDPETALSCIQEGAEFIVTPVTSVATIEICKKHSIAVFPGALTPTEIFTAWQAGGDAIKVFPASPWVVLHTSEA